MSGAFDIQKALFTKLRTDTGVKAALAAALDDATAAAVYDDVPEGAVYPYATVGETTDLQWDTDDTVGREGTYTLHVWSRYRGRKELKDAMDAIKHCLHNQDLTVTGEQIVLVLFEFSDIVQDPDGITRHGAMRYRVISTGT